MTTVPAVAVAVEVNVPGYLSFRLFYPNEIYNDGLGSREALEG